MHGGKGLYPRMKLCALFPGQGFQKFGMLAPLAAKKPEVVGSIVSECKQSLPEIDMERLLLGKGEEVSVTPTELAQPLLLANSIAHFRASNELNDVKIGMGHSLGEYSALVAAELLPFGDALRLLRGRGLAMQEAIEAADVSTGMTLVSKPGKLTEQEWRGLVEAAASDAKVNIGAFNSPAAIVLSGDKEHIASAVDLLKGKNVGRFIAKALPVAGAFHSEFMKPAIPKLEKLVANANWQPIDQMKFSVVSNFTALPYKSIDEVKEACVASLTAPVRWSDSVRLAEKETDEFRSYGGDIGALMAKFVGNKNVVYS